MKEAKESLCEMHFRNQISASAGAESHTIALPLCIEAGLELAEVYHLFGGLRMKDLISSNTDLDQQGWETDL